MSQKVPEGWADTTLGEIAEIVGGSTPSKADAAYWENGSIPWATPSDITRLPSGEFGIEATSSMVSERGLKETSLRLLPPGTVLMTSRATIGYPAINKIPMTTNQGFANFLPNDKFVPKYLVQWINNNRTTLERSSGGSTFLEISKKVLRGLPISLPPLPEQRRIAEILSSVDEAIAATQAVIDKTRTVKQGVLKHLLTKGIGHTRFKQTEIGEIPEGWEVKRFRDVCSLITSGSRGWAQYYSESGALFLRSQNVRCGCLDLTDRQYVRVPAGTEGARTRIVADDLLFTITGNSVGNVASAGDIGEAYVSQHIALSRLNDPMMSEMLVAFFSPDGPGNSQVLNAQYGQSKPGLSLENVRNFFIPIPPRSEIELITDAVRNISMVESQSATALKDKISLKSALMSDLLTGRKRVPLPEIAAAE